jgi:hypothetical protein
MRFIPLAESIVLALPLAARANAAMKSSGGHESKQPQRFAAVLANGHSGLGSVNTGPSLRPLSVRALVELARSRALIVPSVGENIPGEGQ